MQHEDVGTSADLALYRLESAEEDLETARLNFQAEKYKAANNRAYYAIFHAISAVQALDGKAYKRHKDVIGNFNKEYVKTGVFSRDIGKKIAMVEEVRHASDYDDFYVVVIDEVREQIEAAEEILCLIEKYCKERINARSGE
ncbi:MAG: HEPN domain-containing protein [Lachnospiraceae bacterium]|nr:HEPN domain-containing protein [Lachnospiraceae bacterium]